MSTPSPTGARSAPKLAPLIFVVDDDSFAQEFFQFCLTEAGYRVKTFSEARGLERAVAEARPSLVFLDNYLPDGMGIDTLEPILRVDPQLPVILMTGAYSTEGAVEAIRRGAADYLAKPCDEQKFLTCAGRWLAERSRQQRVSDADRVCEQSFQLDGIIGRSVPMQALFGQITRIAPHFDTLLIEGETGTGKDRIASSVHKLGPGPRAPFVPVNCASFTDSLFESELFGHRRGAFTGAVQDHQGLFASASGGTLFLDEIGELPLHLQAKLLRMLQSKEIRPVGSNREMQFDVRVIAATNRDLRTMASQGSFREDLYYRLNTISLRIPPLRERPDDISPLVTHFLKTYSQRYKKVEPRLTVAAYNCVMRFAWPGNVRQLESAMNYCCLTAAGTSIDVADLPEWLTSRHMDPAPANAESFPTLREVMDLHIAKALKVTQGNRKQAAEILGMSRTTLHRFLTKNAQDTPGSVPELDLP